MDSKWIIWALAALVFVASVGAAYFYLPDRYATSPITSLAVLALFVACAPVIRIRFRGIPIRSRAAAARISPSWLSRPPLWLGVVLVIVAPAWLFVVILFSNGSATAARVAFIPAIILVLSGFVVFGARLAAWLQDFLLR